MIEKQKIPWEQKAVFICTKCHKAMDSKLLTEEGNCGENLKTFLKVKIKDAHLANRIRVMTSSCLNVCKENLQAILITEDNKSEVLTCLPEQDRSEILKRIKD